MKTLRYIFLAITLLPFTGCDTNDDGFYNETYVDIPNLLQIEVQPNYATGDHLFIDATISRYLDEPGHELPLDIYTTTGGATSFDYSFVLEKQVGGEWQSVNLTNDMIIINDGGLYNTLPVIFAYAYYNVDTEMYHSNVGIPLETSGQFRLRFGSASESPNKAEIRSQSEGNNLSLNISTIVSQLDTNGYYTFTVN